MIDTTPFPSPLLKLGAFVAKWALRLAALAWIAFAMVWGCLHFVIVPRIDESRPWLEKLATQSLGLPVQIGAVSAQSNGLIPSISLQNVVVLDAGGNIALRLPSVLVDVSPQSVLVLNTEQVSIERPELSIRRSADGRIWIAGVPLPPVTSDTDDPVIDWIFSQPALLLQHGTVQWTDALLGTPTVTITDLNLVLRNGVLNHSIRAEANPPGGWGERVSILAEFKEPFIGLNTNHWRHWKGQVFAELPHFDFSAFNAYVAMPEIQIEQGRGAARAWLDISSGTFRALTADVALQDVSIKTRADLDPVALRTVTGRLGIDINGSDIEYFTRSLQFDTADDLHWPGGNLRVQTTGATPTRPGGGVLEADKLDIAAMMRIAERLPLDDALQAMVRQWSAQGLVDELHATWKGAFDSTASYTLKGRIKDLAVSSVNRPQALRGLNIDFDLSDQTGKATLSMRQGQIDTLGIFDEITLPLEQLNASLQWTRSAAGLELHVSQLQFSNADAQGSAKLRWQSGFNKPNQSAALGQLDLQGSLSRLNLMALHRYLPKVLDSESRNYLRQAILAGRATDVKFRIKGDLDQFPFTRPEQGDLAISANLQNVGFAYAPASFMPKGSPLWPALQQVNAQLDINHDVLQIKNASGKIAGTSSMQFSKAESTLKQLFGNGLLSVSADARGNLPDALKMVNNSPLSAMMHNALAQTSASGSADFKIKLALPILEPERATVQGQIDFNANDIQIMPEIPRLAQVRGQLAFSENSFSTKNLQARALGGDLRMQGGLRFFDEPQGNTPGSSAVLRIQGSATAAGLRQARELDEIARLGQYANGTTTYSAVVGLKSGKPEVSIVSNLSGLALTLPAPFAKTAESVLPVRFEHAILADGTQDKLQINLGKLASAIYIRDISGTTPQVLRGAIAIGLNEDETAPLPADGVVANINIPSLDLDAWSAVASTLQAPTTKSARPATTDSLGQNYLPTTMALRSRLLTFDGRVLNHVLIGGGRSGFVWRANVNADELSGYLEYLQPSATLPGRLYGRLARLSIAQSQAQSVESLLDEQPSTIPALDIVIQNFELRGKNLGRLDIEAVNRGTDNQRDQPREWRLNRFNITMPEAILTATGNWSSLIPDASVKRSGKALDRRRTVLNFKLDILDSGALLSRFGTEGVVRKGSGKVEGQVAWLGSPLTLDYANLGGKFAINIENGQFLKADPGIAKLIGVLSLQALPRRLTLDFNDVFSEGFSFDFVRGDITIENGIARTNNLQMKGINAAVLMEGQADIAKETQNIKVVVIPEINAGSASLLATAINPVVGISTFLAQMILRRPLIEAATQQLLIDGTWVDPKVTRIDRKSGAPETSP